MKIKLFNISLFAILLFANIYSLKAQNHNFQFKHYSLEDGLSQSRISSFYQDQKGFIWLGSIDGLNKFDGLNFTAYKMDNEKINSLSSSWITSMCGEISFGNEYLWVGTSDGLNRIELSTMDITSFKHIEDKNSISNNEITTLQLDSKGDLWIGTKGGGLNRLIISENKFVNYLHNENDNFSLSSNTVVSIYEDKDNVLWVGTDGGMINKYNKQKNEFKRFLIFDGNRVKYNNNYINSFFEDSKKNFWIGTDKGLILFDRAKEVVINNNSSNIKYALDKFPVTSFYEDKRNNLWIATDGGGLKVLNLNNESIQTYTSDYANPNSISDNIILSINEDKTGVIWLGTWSSGVEYFSYNKKQFTTLAKNNHNSVDLTDNCIFSVYKDNSNKLWLGAKSGLNTIDLSNPKVLFESKIEVEHQLLNSRVITIYASQDKNDKTIWFGTNTGLYKYNRFDNHWNIYRANSTDPNSLTHNKVMAILKDSRGELWVGTDGGGLNKFNIATNKFSNFNIIGDSLHGVNSNKIYNIFEDSKNIIWISTNNGLFKYDYRSDSFRVFRYDKNDKNTISGNEVYAALEDSKGRLWFGTLGWGFNLLDRETEKFYRYTENNGLPNNWVYGILEDEENNLWISTNFGICKFNIDEKIFRNFDVNDGLQSNEFNFAHFKDKDGTMYFGGVEGLNIFNPKDIQDDTTRPLVALTDFQIFSKSVHIGEEYNGRRILKKTIAYTDEVELTHEEYIISFEFSALHFAKPKNNSFAYKMEGFEKEWNYVKDRRFVTYTNLPAGEYVFRVKAANKDGYWNEKGTSIKLIVIPPFYRTSWFILLIITAISTIIYGFYKYRTRLLIIRAKELENRVKEKTHDLTIANSNLHEENSERKRMENALRESEVKYRYLVENINDVIFSIIENGILTYISPAIATILGYEPDKLVNNSFRKLFHKDDWARFEKRFDGCKSEKPIMSEYRMYNSKGEILWMRISEKPTIENKTVASSQGVLTDITERKELESQLVQAQKLESIGHLAAGVAHEINTPIQFIGDNTRFISDAFTDISLLQDSQFKLIDAIQQGKDFKFILDEIDTKSKEMDVNFLMEEVPKAINETIDGITRVSTIVNAMKSFSHQGNEEKSSTDINQSIDSTIIISKNEWKYVANIQKDFQPNLPIVQCLSGQLNQVILNLIINASHSISDEIEAGRYEKGEISISTKEIDGYINILIKDNGRGIPENIRDKIFNPFFTTKDVGKGTGQGLSIAYDIIVNKHNGSINFDSQTGKGSTFSIKLPT